MKELTRRQRVYHAMHYQPVDKLVFRYTHQDAGYYEHGEKLNDLYLSLPDDFEIPIRRPIPGPEPGDYDADGNYHAFRKDDWGVTWEYRIFGITGIPYDRPIRTPEDMQNYRTPPHVLCEGPEFEAYAARVRRYKELDYPAADQNHSLLYQRMIALCPDEDVLCDICLDEKEINILADRIAEYDEAWVKRAVKAGMDHIRVLDDYGTERSLIMNPETWRRFFKPRLKRIFQSAVDAGVDIHFHSCGMIWDILPDLREIGVTSVWPQIPAYDMKALADRCRELQLAVEVHSDCARTMITGTPDEVRELVKREIDTFRMMDGGAWMHVEVFDGFPFANIEALVETIAQYR